MTDGGYVALFLASVMVSSVSQILLKRAARRTWGNRLGEYLNAPVLVAYGLFSASTLLTVFAYRGVALSAGPLLEATGYVYIMVLSVLFLSERVTARKLIGNVLIVLGIAVYSLF